MSRASWYTRGALVAMGWNDLENCGTVQTVPRQPTEIPITELAVWSGDQVMSDEEGYLYFISRKDENDQDLRLPGPAPTEVEEVVYGSGLVAEAAAPGAAPRDPRPGNFAGGKPP